MTRTMRTLGVAVLSLSLTAMVAPAHAAVELTTLTVLDGTRVSEVVVPALRVEATLRDLRGRGLVADRQVIYRALEESAPEPDVLRPQQWNLDMIRTDVLSQRQITGSGVVVAIVDTGIDGSHEDLQGQLSDGWDAVVSEPIKAAESQDPFGHGTHVAGIVAALSNNGIGVSSVAPGVTLMPIRVLDEDGVGDDAGVAAGIIWAVDNGADIINLSLGANEASPVMESAVDYADAQGALVVAASGNSGSGPNNPSYPAVHESTIAVASVASDGTRSSFSTYGDYVDIAAPGSNIISTTPDSTYARSSGTSMATPHVSGLLALLASAGYSLADAETALLASAVDSGAPGWDPEYGAGRADAVTAWQHLSGQEIGTVESLELTVPARMRAGIPATVTVTATGEFLEGWPVDIVTVDQSGEAVSVLTVPLDASGTGTGQLVLTASTSVAARADEVRSAPVPVSVSRFIKITSVVQRKAKTTVTFTFSDPGPYLVQTRRGKAAWRTAMRMSKLPGTRARVVIEGKLPAGMRLRILAPAQPDLLAYTTPAVRLS